MTRSSGESKHKKDGDIKLRDGVVPSSNNIEKKKEKGSGKRKKRRVSVKDVLEKMKSSGRSTKPGAVSSTGRDKRKRDRNTGKSRDRDSDKSRDRDSKKSRDRKERSGSKASKPGAVSE
eukprot:CAMPEP_0113641246 /NCGR_PEP_ID=MMETSP0017_2-20120614/21651_1 /TAXON_ID=2856 /ORGANISM="Cylindrotheca closterium" /LENGTH=118 /DNA_ID=CAMNT_0000552575 /DNA_START=205 /DNA_END=558 /DNA_ORIENTATION=- /assembly_acc=CAM_ASM_000147